MNINDLLSQMLMLVIIMVIGILAYKAGFIDSDGNRKLSRLILHVTQTAMIISSAVTSQLALSFGETMKILLCGCGMYVVLFALAYLLTPLFGKDRQMRGVCRFLIVFGNVGFMGFPVINALYGADAVVIAAIYLIPFNVLAYSAGVLMLTGGKGGEGIHLKQIMTPALIASIASLFLMVFRVRFPAPLTNALSTLGSMTVPGAMLVIGVTLGSASIGAVFKDVRVYAVVLVRLILTPMAVWAAARFVMQPLLQVDALYLDMLVVLSTMPSASMTTMLCLEHGIDPRLGSNGVFLTTVLSIVSVPLMVYLLLL